MRISWICSGAISVALAVCSAPVGAAPQAANTGGQLSGFNVVLVEGDLGGSGSTQGLPAAAAKALADLKDFLPYKSYRLLDMQWTLGAGRMTGRLRDANGQQYQLVLTTQYITSLANRSGGRSTSARAVPAPTGDGEVARLRALLADAERRVASTAPDGELSVDRVARLRVELADLEAARAAGRSGVSVNQFQLSEAIGPSPRQMDLYEKGLAPLPNSPVEKTGAPLIDTSFRMDVGETVVVGTSRLQGEKALIVLLTAVGK